MRDAYEALGIRPTLFSFSKELPRWIAQSDFAIARAGAGTLFELVANGIPAFFVPYPYAAGNHQYFNATFLVDQNAGWMAPQEGLQPEMVLEAIAGNICEVSEKLLAMQQPGGAACIAAFLKEVSGH